MRFGVQAVFLNKGMGIMLELRQICKRFGSRIVAENISFTAAAGEITAVLGASGSGKSTLLNMVAGLVLPDSGEVCLNGVALNGIAPENRRVAMMFQDFALLPHLDVRDNAALPLRLRGMGKHEARQRAEAVLAEVGLAELARRQVQSLSGGEQQRTALARALLAEPAVLLLDEPFSALDSALRQRIRSQTAQLVRRYDLPALLVTHDPEEACLLAGKIAVLDGGRLLQCGTPAHLLARPQSAQVARLLGCANVNERFYIPQQAMALHEDGEACELLSCYRDADGWRVRVKHPHWGELACLHTGETAPADGCRVRVQAERAVWFAAAECQHLP